MFPAAVVDRFWPTTAELLSVAVDCRAVFVVVAIAEPGAAAVIVVPERAIASDVDVRQEQCSDGFGGWQRKNCLKFADAVGLMLRFGSMVLCLAK